MDWIAGFQPFVLSFALNVAKLSLWLILLTAIFTPIEHLFGLHPRDWRRPGMLTDLCYYFLNSLLPGAILSLPLGIVATATHALLPASYVGWLAQLPLAVRLVGALVVGEVGFYWGHRLSHEIPLLWRFHAIHHSAAQIDFMVNTRSHPVDMVFTRLCGLTLLYMAGLATPAAGEPSLVPVIVLLVGTVWGFFIHANVRWRLGAVEQVIATPAFHHWHHTLEDHRDHNYASMLPWIDRLFGTFYLPKSWPAAYGIEAPMPAGFAGQLAEPFLPARKADVERLAAE